MGDFFLIQSKEDPKWQWGSNPAMSTELLWRDCIHTALGRKEAKRSKNCGTGRLKARFPNIFTWGGRWKPWRSLGCTLRPDGVTQRWKVCRSEAKFLSWCWEGGGPVATWLSWPQLGSAGIAGAEQQLCLTLQWAPIPASVPWQWLTNTVCSCSAHKGTKSYTACGKMMILS